MEAGGLDARVAERVEAATQRRAALAEKVGGDRKALLARARRAGFKVNNKTTLEEAAELLIPTPTPELVRAETEGLGIFNRELAAQFGPGAPQVEIQTQPSPEGERAAAAARSLTGAKRGAVQSEGWSPGQGGWGVSQRFPRHGVRV